MKRYSLGESVLVNRYIEGFNSFTKEFQIYNVSGITMDKDNNFTAIVEYFERDNEEKLTCNDITKECVASKIMSESLDIPFYIILYTKGTDYFQICNFNDKNTFKKQFEGMHEDEFIEWWNELKGTKQIKLFYKQREYSSWKINEVLEKNGTKWGGDVDGVIIGRDAIYGIIEFRKSSYKKIDKYDPAMFYKGTYNRAGDYQTWLPLVNLAKILKKDLFLITLSMVDDERCGMTIVSNHDEDALFYKNGLHPNNNICNSFEESYQKLINYLTNKHE